jgi:hypothetical protein
MVPSQGIKRTSVIPIASRTNAAASGTVDTLNYGNSLTTLVRGVSRARIDLFIRHAPTALSYAAATAFSPAIQITALSADVAQTFRAVEILNPDHGRYLVMKLSATGAAVVCGADTVQTKGATIGMSATDRGFLAITTVPTQP